jgi:hypothetical protein
MEGERGREGERRREYDHSYIYTAHDYNYFPSLRKQQQQAA